MIDTTSKCGISYSNHERGPLAIVQVAANDSRVRQTFSIALRHSMGDEIDLSPVEAAELSAKLAAFARENGAEP